MQPGIHAADCAPWRGRCWCSADAARSGWPWPGGSPSGDPVVLAARRGADLDEPERRPARRRRRGRRHRSSSTPTTSPPSAPCSTTSARRHGPLDVVVVAFGILGDQARAERDAEHAARDRAHRLRRPRRPCSPTSPQLLRAQGSGTARGVLLGRGRAGAARELRLRLGEGRARRVRVRARRRPARQRGAAAAGPARVRDRPDDRGHGARAVLLALPTPSPTPPCARCTREGRGVGPGRSAAALRGCGTCPARSGGGCRGSGRRDAELTVAAAQLAGAGCGTRRVRVRNSPGRGAQAPAGLGAELARLRGRRWVQVAWVAASGLLLDPVGQPLGVAHQPVEVQPRRRWFLGPGPPERHGLRTPAQQRHRAPARCRVAGA